MLLKINKIKALLVDGKFIGLFLNILPDYFSGYKERLFINMVCGIFHTHHIP